MEAHNILLKRQFKARTPQTTIIWPLAILFKERKPIQCRKLKRLHSDFKINNYITYIVNIL